MAEHVARNKHRAAIGPALTSVGDPATTLRQTEYVAYSLPTSLAPQIHRIVAEHPHVRFPLPTLKAPEREI